MPFRFMSLSGSDSDLFQPGKVISTLNECGLFMCTHGEAEVAYDNKVYHIRPGDVYIYMPSVLVRLLRRSDDAEGFLVVADVNFALATVQRAIDANTLLHVRTSPCFSPTEEEYNRLKKRLEDLWQKIGETSETPLGIQRKLLTQELLKSLGQTLIFELLDIYFIHHPFLSLPQGKKDIIFHNFLLALFRHFRREREVAFYANLQHLTPRYFSAIIKEKSGSNPLQWIVQMVITEAKILLETSDLSIKEIAMKLNFPTQSFFGKYFKQYVGVSPKDYREKKFS